jgi:AcrR family transcriptional regulator
VVALPEQASDKAARLLVVAKELVLRHGVKGVTIASIAKKAHVGHGTVYLYWATKEDLMLGLFARDFLAMLDEYSDALTTDPDFARPQRLCPMVIRTVLRHPFVRALQTGDADLLGVLTDHPDGEKLVRSLGPHALMSMVLPIWRKHGMARTDWELDRQAYALAALMTGFFESARDARFSFDLVVESPDDVMAQTVTAVLGPDRSTVADVRAVAEEGLRQLQTAKNGTLATIALNES